MSLNITFPYTKITKYVKISYEFFRKRKKLFFNKKLLANQIRSNIKHRLETSTIKYYYFCHFYFIILKKILFVIILIPKL